MILKITITQITENDYDGNPETTKTVTGTLDNKRVPETIIYANGQTESEIKTAYRDKLTALGYTWDSEE